jgi:predicted ATPase
VELDFQPAMVGRDEELKELEAYLDKANEGKGNTIFISGEAGIGKTKLVSRLEEIAKNRGFQVLTGYSMHESLTPYMPFYEALRSGGLDFLFEEEAPKVEAVYLIAKGGKLVKEVLREETDLNPDIFASMLTAIGNFVSESLTKLSGERTTDALQGLSYGEHHILIEAGEVADLAVIAKGKGNEFLVEDMREILDDVNAKYGHVLKNWKGEDESVEGTEELLMPLITSGKYDGIYYGKDDPKARRNLLFENVSLGLIRHAQTGPTLFCIEDLQWADPSSLALMHYVSRNARKSGLLLLGTYRPEDVAVADGKSHPLIEAKQLMDREGLYEEVELERLPRESLDEVLSSMLGDIDFDDDVKDRIYRETEGNPLFIIELVKLLVEEQIIKTYDGTWKLEQDLGEVDIPSKIYGVIARRLNRVKEEDRKVLEYASVIGEMFTSRILVEGLKIEKMELLERLRVLEKTHRLVNSTNGRYKFDHAKIKEVLYSGIPQELRMEYHAVIADSLEILNKDDLDEVVGDLAFHYYHCRNKEKALHYLTKAAEKAKKEYSNEEAIRFYTQALDFEEDMQKRRETFEALGRIYFLMGDYDKSMESYRNALELAKGKNKSAEIMAKIGQIHQKKGEYEESIRICTEALDLVKGEVCKEEVLCLSSIGTVHLLRGQYDKSLEFHEKSLVIGEKIGDQRGITGLLNSIGFVHISRGDSDKALELLEKSLEIMEKIGDQMGIAHALNNIGYVHYQRGDYDRVLEFNEKSLAIEEKIGDRGGFANSLHNIGNAHFYRGNYDKALEFYEKSLAINEKIGYQMGIANSLHNIGNVHFYRGDYDNALELLEKSLEIREKLGSLMSIAGSLHNIGNVHISRGDYDKALELLEKSLEICDEIGDKRESTFTYCNLAETYLRKKDLTEAMEFCEKAFNLSKEIDFKENIGNSKRIFGKIYSERNEWNLAVESFQESIRILADLRMNFELGNSYYEFGLMWKKKGGDEDARINLNRALEIFEKLKLDKWAEKTKAELDVFQT